MNGDHCQHEIVILCEAKDLRVSRFPQAHRDDHGYDRQTVRRLPTDTH
jgi:hypothetical protein